jgi:hypothetical protein
LAEVFRNKEKKPKSQETTNESEAFGPEIKETKQQI